MKNHPVIAAGFIGGFLLALAGCATTPKPAEVSAPERVPLKLYWNGHDNFTTATARGDREAKAAGYHLVRIEGYVFSQPSPDTIPLTQYWSDLRQDYMLLGKALPKTLKNHAGYRAVGIEGYAYPGPHPGAVPLKRYSLVAGDNLTTATAQGEKDALAAGYGLRRTEGYVLAATNQASDNGPMTHYEWTSKKGVVLKGHERLDTPGTFRPPVEITIVAKTDSTNLRIGYAADQVIFNWELDRTQLRVDGGPANGQHQMGAGGIPSGKFVTIRWLVTPTHQAIYVDNQLRFEHSGDYSNLNNCVSVFPAEGSQVTVKSVTVEPLPVTPLPQPGPPPPRVKVRPVSAEQIQRWITQLGDADFSQRQSAAHELARNAAALPALQQALQTATDGDRRWWLQSALQSCEENQPQPGEISARPGADHGLQVCEAAQNGDGLFAGIKHQGVACWEVPKKGNYLYFIASDAFRQKNRHALEIQLEYLDAGHGDIALDYDSMDSRAPVGGAYKNHSTVIHRDDSGQWRDARFYLPDARFSGSENDQADFRFYNGGERLIIRSVRVWPTHAEN